MPTADKPFVTEPHDFSPVLGGPLYELLRLVPFTVQTVLHLAVVTLAPVVPLALTMISLDEWLTQALRMVF